jgi:hypothetical protein
MNDIEQRIRELPLPSPSAALDERMADLFATARASRRPPASRLGVAVGTALAAGIAGFAAGLGTGQLFLAPRGGEPIVVSAPQEREYAIGTPASYVQLTDLRVGAGLDFSRSLEPFQVQLTSQEGS